MNQKIADFQSEILENYAGVFVFSAESMLKPYSLPGCTIKYGINDQTCITRSQ